MKVLFLSLITLICVATTAQAQDTLTVIGQADGYKTWYIRTQSHGSYRLGPTNPFGSTQPSVVLSTIGEVDTIDFYVGTTRVKRYSTANYVAKETECPTCDSPQDIVNYWNWYKLQRPVNKVLIPNLTTAQRDSFYNWGPPAVGTRIFNTTIDSPQISVSGTITWRNH